MIRRGDVHDYLPVVARPGISRRRLIVSADGINADDALPVVLALHVVDDDPGGLLAVAVEGGWVSALTIEPVMRSRLGGVLATLDADTMERVGIAMRTAQHL